MLATIPLAYEVVAVGFLIFLYAISGSVTKRFVTLPRDRKIRGLVALAANAAVIIGWCLMIGLGPPEGWDYLPWIIVTSVVIGVLLIACDYVVWQRILKPPSKIRLLVILEKMELDVLESIWRAFEVKYNRGELGNGEESVTGRGKLGGEIRVTVDNASSPLDALSKLEKEQFDVVAFDITFRGELVRRGLASEITEQELRSPQTRAQLIDVLWVEGKKYFLPFRPNVKVVLLNKDAFAEFDQGKYTNLVPGSPNLPRSWKDFLDLAKKFQESDKHPRVAVMAKGIDGALLLLEVIRSAGGRPENLHDGRTREALHFLRSFRPHVGNVCKGLTFDTVMGQLTTGKLYLARTWAYGLRFLEKRRELEKYVVYPGFIWSKQREPAYLLGGDVLAIGSATRHRKVALKLIDYLLSEEVQSKLLTELFWPSARIDVPITLRGADEASGALIEGLSGAMPTPFFWSFEMSEIFTDLFKAITEGQADIETELEEFQSKITAEIQRQQCQQ